MSSEGSAGSGMVTSIARLDSEAGGETRLAQVLDVETILRKMNRQTRTKSMPPRWAARSSSSRAPVILAADDSVVARSLIEQGLEAMGLPFVMTKTGKEAWDQLNYMASAAETEGKTVYDKVALVLTDLEMPEMDGFTLTRSIKKSAKFGSMPVVIHSSLSGTTNEEHVKTVGRRCLRGEVLGRGSLRDPAPRAEPVDSSGAIPHRRRLLAVASGEQIRPEDADEPPEIGSRLTLSFGVIMLLMIAVAYIGTSRLALLYHGTTTIQHEHYPATVMLNEIETI